MILENMCACAHACVYVWCVRVFIHNFVKDCGLWCKFTRCCCPLLCPFCLIFLHQERRESSDVYYGNEIYVNVI